VVKAVFHLSLRATPEFLESVVRLMGVELPVPDYTTVSRRQGGLELKLGPGARLRAVPRSDRRDWIEEFRRWRVVRRQARYGDGAEPGGNCISAWTRGRKISWRSI
jgi:hypothetical protein